MAEQNSILFTVDDFSKGDYGTLSGERAPKGTFRGHNVLVYASGMVGPRAGLKDQTPASMPTGKLLTLQSTPVVGRDGLFVIGNTVYRFDLYTVATAPTAYTGALAVTSTVPLHPFLWTDGFYMAVPADKVYFINPAASTVAGVTSSPGGNDVIIRDGQMIVSGDGQSGRPLYRLLASLPGDITDWTEGRFLDIGDNWQVTAMAIQRNYLSILKRNGAHVLSGILGDPSTEQLRQVSKSTTTLWPWNAALDEDDQFWFIPVFRDNVARFTSAQVQQLAQLPYDSHEHDDPALDAVLVQGLTILQGDQTPSTVVAVRAKATQEALVQHNGVWTRQFFETTVSGMCAGDHENLIITDGGAAGVAAKIYSTNFQLNRPAFTNDTFTAPGDNSNTPLAASFIAPQWWSPAGREVQVRQVVVDFESWNTGTSATNHFDVTVRILGRQRVAEKVYSSDADAAPDPFDQAVASSSVSGTRQRKEFNFLCAPGAGVEVSFTNMRGVAIRSFTVLEARRDNAPFS